MRFLISTDNHCGYGEVRKINYDDAFTTLDEVFELAKKEKVDFILLGGDLFHDNNPTRETRIRVMRTFRKYTLNGPQTEIEFMSRPEHNFAHSSFKCVNFEDENLCISIPVFSIHGNHDDLSGTSTSALDVLHEAGLLNLFGRFVGVDRYVVDPILLRKKLPDGTYSKLAIYGISSQRDDRLARSLESGKVTFRRPSDADSWSSVLILHQNRPIRSTIRSTGAFIDVQNLPTFFNLIIWGHEHESITEPEYIVSKANSDEGYWILQPGSTVLTSLTATEAKPKHSFIVEFQQNNRRPIVNPYPLLTPRQAYYDELNLGSLSIVPPSENIRLEVAMDDEVVFRERVEEILEKAAAEHNGIQPELPLIRVKLIYSGRWKRVPPLSARKAGAQFAGRVANALDILGVGRERVKDYQPPLPDTVAHEVRTDEKAAVVIQHMINEHFETATGADRLKVLRNDAMFAAITEYNNSTSKGTVLDSQLKKCIRSQVVAFSEKLMDITTDFPLNSSENSYKDFETQLESVVGNDNFSQAQFRPVSQNTEYRPAISQVSVPGENVSGDNAMEVDEESDT
ncbi:Double-strand break repair protein [Aphelenchoides bicaudatus]|nr:Double-strand break repair protein [Aphelenchoides bicaudatus]